MKYDFDKIIDRVNTDSVKYDLRKKVFGTNNLIPMWVADMDFETPDFITNAINERTKHKLLGYSYKSSIYYKSIVNWLELQHNWLVHPKHISFSPGVVPGLVLSIMAFTQPGDKIIVQSPVYFPFYTSIKENGRQIINNSLVNNAGHYTMDLKLLKSQIDNRTSMIIISNPHNPVGRAWSKEELSDLLDICVKNNVLILSDEIHSDLVFEPNKHVPMASISDQAKNHVITFMAASKTFNIAGLNSSFVIIANPKLRAVYNSYLDSYHLYLGNIFGSVATESAYANGADWLLQLKKYIAGNIRFAMDYFQKNIPQIQIKEPEATYLLWLDFKFLKMSDKDLNKFLINDAKLGLNQGSVFGVEGAGFMRMNIACPRSVLEKALRQLEKAVDQS